MKTKVVLIDAQGHWLKKNRNEVDQVVLPLGLMYLAAYSRNIFGDDIEFRIYNSIVDFDNDPVTIRNCIRRETPDIVGIRGMTRYQDEFAQIARIAKEHSKALVVGGGPYVSSDEHAVLSTEIDLAVMNEGEVTFAEVIRSYRAQQPFESILGIAFRKESRVKRTAIRPFMNADELDAMPFPAYDLINIDEYSRHLSYGYNKRRQGVVFTSRGCPYRCDFCHVLFGKQFRQRSPHSLMAEFCWLYDRWQIRDFYIVDDIFNLHKARALEFFEMLSSSHMKGNIRIYFVNGLRGDRVDESFIDAAVRAGAIWFAYAVETASPRLQKQIQKCMNIEKVKHSIEYSIEKGVAVVYWGMLGIDSETIEEAQATVDLLNAMPPSTIPMLFCLKSYPGTETYIKLKAKEQQLGGQTKLQFQNAWGEYHDFIGLMKKDRRYFDVLKSWMDKVQSLERMRKCTKTLIKIGHTDDDVKTAYQLLYRKLPEKTVDKLIEWCRNDLRCSDAASLNRQVRE